MRHRLTTQVLPLVLLALSLLPGRAFAQGADMRFNTIKITSTSDTAVCVGSAVGVSTCLGGISLATVTIGGPTTAGVRVDVTGGVYRVQEGDASAFAPIQIGGMQISAPGALEATFYGATGQPSGFSLFADGGANAVDIIKFSIADGGVFTMKPNNGAVTMWSSTAAGAVTIPDLTVTTLNTFTFNQSVANGASPTFATVTATTGLTVSDGNLRVSNGGSDAGFIFHDDTALTLASNINDAGTRPNAGRATAKIVIGSGVSDGSIGFYTTPTNNAAPVLRMTLTSDGFLNGLTRLDVNADGRIAHNHSSLWLGSNYSQAGVVNNAARGTSAIEAWSPVGAGYITFKTGAVNTAPTEKWRIDETGHLVAGGAYNISTTGAVSAASIAVGGGTSITNSSNIALLNAANSFTSNGITSFAGNISLSSTAGGIGVRVRNTVAGAGNYSEIRLGNDAAVGTLDLYATSTTYTPSGPLLADAGVVYAGGAGGLSLAAAGAAGDVRLYSRNVLALTLGASQAATFTGAISSTSNATHRFGSGTTSTNTPNIIIDGGSGTAGGAFVGFAKNGSGNGYIGHVSAILGSGTSSQFLVYGDSADGVSIRAANASGDLTLYSRNALAGTFGASQAFTLTGAFNVPGLVSLTGSAANIALGSNYLSGDGADEGIAVDASGNASVSGQFSSVGASFFSGDLRTPDTGDNSAYIVATGGVSTVSPANLDIASTFAVGGGAAPSVTIGRNSNTGGTGTAGGTLGFTKKSGLPAMIWIDDTGVVRTANNSWGENAGDAGGDTGGTVVGTQTSMRSTKNVYGEFTDYSGALRAVLATPLYDFDYKSGSYNGQRFVGIMTDDSPVFGMDKGRSFNPVTAFGYTVAAIKELERRLSAAEAVISAMGGRIQR